MMFERYEAPDEDAAYDRERQRQIDDEAEAEREQMANSFTVRAAWAQAITARVAPHSWHTRSGIGAGRGSEDAFSGADYLGSWDSAKNFGWIDRSRQTYAERVRALEDEGLTTSDAQAVVDAEDLKGSRS